MCIKPSAGQIWKIYMRTLLKYIWYFIITKFWQIIGPPRAASQPRSWHPNSNWEFNCCRQFGQQNISQATFVKFHLIWFKTALDWTHTTLCESAPLNGNCPITWIVQWKVTRWIWMPVAPRWHFHWRCFFFLFQFFIHSTLLLKWELWVLLSALRWRPFFIRFLPLWCSIDMM